ncbi:hypothetical protein F5Y13DRAFT_169315 [Hypoxylon sp. FL1857]|nr:hypothetical protein F5Y13DRAFT_169315 [Hypoxylon sp. FL1857]
MNDIENSLSYDVTSDHNETALDNQDPTSIGKDAHRGQQPRPAPQEDTADSSRVNSKPPITFAGLPPEVREMIWQYAIPEPRIFNALVYASAGLKMQLLDRSSLKMPLALVCFESRQVVRKAGYVLAFRDEDEPNDPGVWFKPYYDIIERTLWGPGDFWGLGLKVTP